MSNCSSFIYLSVVDSAYSFADRLLQAYHILGESEKGLVSIKQQSLNLYSFRFYLTWNCVSMGDGFIFEDNIQLTVLTW